jgi:signal transduction histidine kinase
LQDRKLEAQTQQLQQLYQQVQAFNEVLEQQVEERTAQLNQLLKFEAMLNRITDKVRESLDENQILQTAVQELMTELTLTCCTASFYDLDRRITKIHYEASQVEIKPARGIVVSFNNSPDLYPQILQGQQVHCCIMPRQTEPQRKLKTQSTVLICPLRDQQEVIGDLWLFKPQAEVFEALEIQIVQQVANQCAIALRQSRLYQLLKAQVEELERLSQIKDDFLSSISHELRSPMATMRMAIQMLEIILQSASNLKPELNSADRYIQILKDECQRETNLINDLLDMARLDAGAAPLNVTTLSLSLWLPIIAEPFVERTRSQQQHFVLDTATGIPDLNTDPSYLERALSELLHNACKYTPAGESITLTTCLKGAIFQISVRNTGVEIPASEHDRIFDKFYRITHIDRRQQGGTGLGLALVKKQIERLQGTIEVASEPGWTMFTLQVPSLAL